MEITTQEIIIRGETNINMTTGIAINTTTEIVVKTTTQKNKEADQGIKRTKNIMGNITEIKIVTTTSSDMEMYILNNK